MHSEASSLSLDVIKFFLLKEPTSFPPPPKKKKEEEKRGCEEWKAGLSSPLSRKLNP